MNTALSYKDDYTVKGLVKLQKANRKYKQRSLAKSEKSKQNEFHKKRNQREQCQQINQGQLKQNKQVAQDLINQVQRYIYQLNEMDNIMSDPQQYDKQRERLLNLNLKNKKITKQIDQLVLV
ncbi:hypothetical protein PPERSA_11788 [Pseudocohnilembus persalinus]|uniref:Uncharacterized protein n=1 Tax=Pseudocohnilembus persalinus TaxID=266149 RepID=A0A0V0QR95_PSEPJ|nr:hypothetical protein PPERSA_11788 [Pseudocohnilembus persalinus]|eukprot:KRX04732.1 hypothetical protein PPERSA_11788 [Pseudocohnilembus persalinus]